MPAGAIPARAPGNALIDEERIDEVLQIVTLPGVAETWMRYQR